MLAAVLVAGTFNTFPRNLHIAWLSAITAISIARLVLNIAYARAQPSSAEHRGWRRAFLIGVGAAGIIWGSAGWYYFQTAEFIPRLLLVCILVGMNAGAARSLASVPWSYRIYVFTTLGPLLARFLTLPDRGAWTLDLITVTYALFLLNTAGLHHADLRKLWRLIFENEKLVGRLSEEKERAEAASIAKSEFLATMSHEIRTPMNGIMGMLQVLEHSPLSADQKNQLEIASGSADTLMRLLNDILDFSKIESGKLEFESLTYSLPATITEVAALLRPRATEKGLELSVELPSNLPTHVIGDAIRLKQVLLNLTGNAIKFTELGRVALIAELLRREPKTVTLRFRVRDTGIGMDEATQAKLFQMFSQGDSSTTRRFGGSGLGLAISQRLVNRMGGNIRVESERGSGSDFSFDLTMPLGTSPSEPGAALSTQPRQLSGRLLVVEDDRVNQRVIELLLKKIGLQSVIVADGAAAIEVATFEQWDAVLMDCQMPGVDGFEATRRIRERLQGRRLPIIALTATAMTGDRERCSEAGMDDFIAKPVRQEELRTCLERWLPKSKRPEDD